MKHRLYLDTSVFGGVFDEEFSKYSIQLFDQVKRGKAICVLSKLVGEELEKSPKQVKSYFEQLPSIYFEKLIDTAQMDRLAEIYLDKKIVGQNIKTIVNMLPLQQFIKLTY